MRCLQEGWWRVWFLCSRRCWTKDSLKDSGVAQRGRWWQKLYNTAIRYWTELKQASDLHEPLGSSSFVYILFIWLLFFFRVKIYCVYCVWSSLCMWEQWRVGDLCFQGQTLLASLVGCGSLWIDGRDQISQKSEEFTRSGDGKRCWKILLMACLNIFMYSMDWTLSSHNLNSHICRMELLNEGVEKLKADVLHFILFLDWQC